MSERGRVAGAAAVGVAVVAGLLLGSYWLFVLTLAVVYALAALSFVVLTGWSGQLNLHVAALGLGWGAYAGFALVVAGLPPLWAILFAGVLAVPFAAGVAFAAVRFRGLDLAVATLAIGAIFERLFFRNLGKALARSADSATPFESSFVPMPRPSLGAFTLDGDRAFYFFSLAVCVAMFVVASNLGRGATGRTLRALREREVMAETLGVPVIRHRMGVFVFSIVIASTAGALFASLKSGIAPDSFNLDLSFQLLAATVIGGIASPWGAVIGGGLVALLPEVVARGPLSIFSGERTFVLFGVGMILVLWRSPRGLVGLRRSRAGASEAPATAPVAAALSAAPAQRHRYADPLERASRPVVLRVDGVRVRFGGVVALDGVSLSVADGEICAVIGPNGAGKSTLFNCVGGLITPDEGRIFFRGGDVTEMPPHRRAARGLGRTFQTIEAFRELSVLDNLMVAGHRLRTARSFADALALPASRRSERALRDRAREVAAVMGLEPVLDVTPGSLPLGSLRVLEVGMALVARPSLLLLDEPSAGLDPAETGAMSEVFARVRDAYGLSVLLVEHDMSVVGSLAEHVYVLDFGTVIAQGAPERVREDPLVIEKYLGAGAAPEPAATGRKR